MQEALSIPSHPYEQPTAVSVSPELELGGSGVTQNFQRRRRDQSDILFFCHRGQKGNYNTPAYMYTVVVVILT